MSQHEGMGSPPDREPSPDFVALYPVDARGGDGLTPRLAYHLWHCSMYLADTWRDNLDRPDELLQQLPPTVQRFAGPLWLARFIECFEALAEKLAHGVHDHETVAACTAEEMALHLVIDLAGDFVQDGMFEDDQALLRLPGDAKVVDDFEWVREALLEDYDVLALFNPALDGIEDSFENAHLRLVNLHPSEWFEPFDTDE